jgi:predicted amidohydrolase YtcJ
MYGVPNQKVTVEQAIKIGTINGAYASFDEKHKGSLEAGKLADIVVLGRDPFKRRPFKFDHYSCRADNDWRQMGI